MAIASVALVLLAFLPAHPDYWDIAWRMSLCGAGFGTFLSPNARLIIGSAPRHRAASAGGLVATTRLFGQTIAATALAFLLALGLGEGVVPALVSTALTIFAAFCSLSRLRLNAAPLPDPVESAAAAMET
jgi:DHA2 family multidrug resistance protein-like MFS transporter